MAAFFARQSFVAGRCFAARSRGSWHRGFSSVPPLVLSTAERQSLESRLSCSGPETLRHALREFATKSRALPHISNYHVEAAGLGASGRVYFGVNVEIPGHPLSATTHAEQFVLASAALHGERQLQALVVNAPPCGHCRQFMNELGNGGLGIHVIQENGSLSDSTQAKLLPDDFGPRHLGIEAGLLDEAQGHNLLLPAQLNSLHDLAAEALLAANRSFTPYTNCPAGVALRLRDGRLFGGFYIESAAYNPSLPPLQVALVNAMVHGLTSFDEVDEIALVELARAKVSFARSTYLLNKRMHLMHAVRAT